MAFAEAEGGFEGFVEAGAVLFVGGEAVLDDVDLFFSGEGFGEGFGGGGVGAVGLAVEEEAEVALGLEEGEEVLGGGFLGRGMGKRMRRVSPGWFWRA